MCPEIMIKIVNYKEEKGINDQIESSCNRGGMSILSSMMLRNTVIRTMETLDQKYLLLDSLLALVKIKTTALMASKTPRTLTARATTSIGRLTIILVFAFPLIHSANCSAWKPLLESWKRRVNVKANWFFFFVSIDPRVPRCHSIYRFFHNENVLPGKVIAIVFGG